LPPSQGAIKRPQKRFPQIAKKSTKDWEYYQDMKSLKGLSTNGTSSANTQESETNNIKMSEEFIDNIKFLIIMARL
jgi:hypothetical protein